MQCSVLLLIFFLCSCSTLNKKGEWGRHALHPITLKNVNKAFVKNISNPQVWAPMFGAGFIYFGGYDQKISDWATDSSVVFKDEESAAKYSNTLLDILQAEAYASIFLPPSLPQDGDWKEYSWRKLKGGSVAYLGTGLAHSAGTQLKNNIPRERPNSKDDRSFPSGHAIDVGASHFLIARNFEISQINPYVKVSLKYLNLGMASAASWARVEANAHFASDALAGYAVGTFVSGFVYDSLMNLDDNESITLFPVSNGGVTATYSYIF